ncbi:MAG TPA: hypothetical protein VN702_09510 [Acetobacteraceae bacterium]|nr:hypothetical protein [Acetobacteraceae bacterium]
MPASLIADHHGMFAGEPGGELVQGQLHRLGVEVWEHQRERLTRPGLHSGEQVRPGVALIA